MLFTLAFDLYTTRFECWWASEINTTEPVLRTNFVHCVWSHTFLKRNARLQLNAQVFDTTFITKTAFR
ncbi:MAG: hypothetical protein AAI978_00375 [Candidatus Hodgkinia cicadicola]